MRLALGALVLAALSTAIGCRPRDLECKPVVGRQTNIDISAVRVTHGDISVSGDIVDTFCSADLGHVTDAGFVAGQIHDTTHDEIRVLLDGDGRPTSVDFTSWDCVDGGYRMCGPLVSRPQHRELRCR